MYDLQTLRTLNARREATLRAQRAERLTAITRVLAQSESLALDNAADRLTLARRLEVVL